MGWLVTGRRLRAFERALGRLFRRFRGEVWAEFALASKRVERIEDKLFALEGRLAAIEATHHKVGYVPVDAFKALSEKDIEQMANVSESVRDQLKEIVALQERLEAAGNPAAHMDEVEI